MRVKTLRASARNRFAEVAHLGRVCGAAESYNGRPLRAFPEPLIVILPALHCAATSYKNKNMESDLTTPITRQLCRPSEACTHFKISRATLCHWVRFKPGFPQPLRPSSRVTLHDVGAIEVYMKLHGH